MKALIALVLIVGLGVLSLALLLLMDRRADRLERERLIALQPAMPEPFDPRVVADLPEPARRYFGYTIRPGTPILPVAEIEMRGEFSLGRKEAPNYQPMEAHQILAAPEGFVWAMHTTGGMPVSGSDSGRWTRFRIFGLIPVARLGGDPDHTRSAYGRYVGEAVIWSPAAVLPGPGVTWEAVDEDTARVTVAAWRPQSGGGRHCRCRGPACDRRLPALEQCQPGQGPPVAAFRRDHVRLPRGRRLPPAVPGRGREPVSARRTYFPFFTRRGDLHQFSGRGAMTRSAGRFVLPVVAAVVLWLAAAAAAFADEDAEIAALLDALADAVMVTDQVPGAIAAIVSGDTVILRGYGVADLDGAIAASPDQVRFEIGSITKLFTWIAVMMLVEEGRLDLEADVARHLPDVEVPGTEPLTLAQLMSHRGGFEESYAIFDPAVAALPRAEALSVAAPDQVFPRGAVTSYSNWGAALAGHIVEEVSGEPWEAFVEARILGPLGMDDTTTAERLRRPDQPPLAGSYRVQGGVAHPAFRVDIGAFGPAGAIASTAADMARFLRFLMGDGALDGVRLLQPETMAQLRSRLFDDRLQAADMAHGFQARPMFGTTVYGHGGGVNEFLSNLVVIPEIGAGVFISQNGGTGADLPLMVPTEILGAMAARAGLEAPEPDPVPDATARAAEAAGRYLTNRRTFSGPGQFLAALSPLNVTALPDGTLLIPTPLSQGPVRHEPFAPDIWQDAQGARMAFLRDETGRIVRLADGTGRRPTNGCGVWPIRSGCGLRWGWPRYSRSRALSGSHGGMVCGAARGSARWPPPFRWPVRSRSSP